MTGVVRPGDSPLELTPATAPPSLTTDPDGVRCPHRNGERAQIRATRTDLAAVEDFAVTVAANVATVSLTGTQTGELGQFSGYWDVQWAPSGGQPVTIVQGPVRCGLDVTR